MSANQGQGAKTREHILVVDDTLDNLRLLSAMLTKQGYNVRKAISGQMALTSVEAVAPDLILLDIMMPEMDGYTVCDRLKSNPDTAEIPIIFLSALNETVDKVKGFTIGGADYITKPFHVEEVLARVRHQLAMKAATREIQRLNAELERRVQERTQELEQANQQLTQMALFDGLTHLPNRISFVEQLRSALEKAAEIPGHQFAVLFLDCDRFRVINDSLGHNAGNQLLLAIAQRLHRHLRPTDCLARLEGDEFTVLVNPIGSEAEAIALAEQMLTTLSYPFQIAGREIFISASVGIAFNNIDCENPEHLLRNADTAMYHAKNSGRSRCQLFDTSMHHAALHRLDMEIDLRRALSDQEFIVYYQPIVSLSAHRVVGLEALIRWKHPERGLVSPVLFVSIAEETGLICQIGHWVLKEACRQLHQWHQQCRPEHPVFLSVNLSARQFVQPNLVEQIDAILAETQLDPKLLKLEITESAIIENTDITAETLDLLKKRHIQISIDDFGTGYSSLSYLHCLPVETLKIDASFIKHIDVDGESLELVRAIVSLAWNLGMEVVAEGVETAKQLAQLKALKCDFAQGYLFSEPLPFAEI
ncbi:MAG TPA: EAL domain-containing protein, partial [Chroococcidiopsis sp.]